MKDPRGVDLNKVVEVGLDFVDLWVRGEGLFEGGEKVQGRETRLGRPETEKRRGFEEKDDDLGESASHRRDPGKGVDLDGTKSGIEGVIERKGEKKSIHAID